MPGHARETEAVHQGVEVVARMLRIERARQLHGAQHRRGELHAEPAEFCAQEAVIEACVVSDEQPALEPAPHFLRHVGKGRRVRHHRVIDAGERRDQRRNPDAGMHQRAPFLDDLAVLEQHDADFDDAVLGRHPARGLEIDAGDGTAQRCATAAR